MEIFLVTALFLLVIFAAMAIGVIFGRGPIKGSCGGIAALTGERSCELCGGDRLRCEEINGQAPRDGDSGGSAGGQVRQFDPRDPR